MAFVSTDCISFLYSGRIICICVVRCCSKTRGDGENENQVVGVGVGVVGGGSDGGREFGQPQGRRW